MPDAARLRLKVVPRASRSGLAGWVGDALKVRVGDPPEHGKANATVIAVVARALGVAPARVRLIAGETRERKIVAVEGLSETELRARIDRALDRRRQKVDVREKP